MASVVPMRAVGSRHNNGSMTSSVVICTEAKSLWIGGTGFATYGAAIMKRRSFTVMPTLTRPTIDRPANASLPPALHTSATTVRVSR